VNYGFIKKIALIIVLLFIAGGMLPAIFGCNAIAKEDRPVTLDTIIVTGSDIDETHQTGDVDKETTPAFYTVIKKDAFEGRMQSVGEVINKSPGIQVRQSGGLGSFSTVSLRGSNSDQVMVYLDGVLLNDASGGGVDLSDISLSDVASIEIYRGITPAQFPGASIGGVINIKTRRSTPGLKGHVLVGYGSFNTKKFSGFINNKLGRWDYLISGDSLDSANNFRFKNDNGTPDNPNDDTWQDRNNAQFDQTNLLTRIGYNLTDSSRIDLTNYWFSKNLGIPTWNNYPNATSYDTRQNISTLKLTANDITPLHLNTFMQFNYLDKNEVYNDSRMGSGAIGLGRQYTRYRTRHYDAVFYAESSTENQTINTTLKVGTETYQPTDLLASRTYAKSCRNSLDAVVQDTLFLHNDKLSITPGIRYQIISDKFASDVSYAFPSVQNTRYSKVDATPQVGFKYRLFRGVILKSNLAQYVRYPSFYELFGDRGIFIGNTALKPEKGINFDAGIEWNRHVEYPWLDQISAGADYYESRINDLITRLYDARGIGKSVNIARAVIRGVEMEFSADLFDFLKITGNGTWQDTKNENTANPNVYGNQLPGKFRLALMGRIEARFQHIRIYTEYLHASGMYYDTYNLLDASTKNQVNCGTSLLWKQFQISIEARNIGNDWFQDFNGYPMPGRSYFATIKYDFK